MGNSGFTVVLCGATGCRGAQHEPLREVLRAVVRSTELGVLVVSGCMCGPRCADRRSADRSGDHPGGVLVAVQPCDVERRPVAPVVLIGPIRTAGDVAAVREWLAGPRHDRATLPARLVGQR